jgi:hypothetical protein
LRSKLKIIENIAQVQPNQSERKQQKAAAQDKSESGNPASRSAPTNLFILCSETGAWLQR